uniref:Olfactory receptor n=1 Tax=Leptobrachium leishanense TaxID=445787 RepID=A0A8C5MJ11_9ANUR
MEKLNRTSVTEFILTGLTELPWLQKVLFVVIFVFYVVNIVSNLGIVTLVSRNTALQSPMYFFLANLSFIDIFYSTVSIPKMLAGFFMENIISFKGCITQLYFFHFLGCIEGILLAVMGYDRYVAICNPLQYQIVMDKFTCILLVFSSWIVGVFYSLTHSLMASQLPFCKVKKIKHFMCDVKPVLRLACADTFLNEITVMLVTGFIGMVTFFITVVSYVYIFMNLMKIHSVSGRSKAFSTCSSHITIVIFFFGTAMCTYLGPTSEGSIEKDKVAALLFTVVTPTLNPLIYTIRNQEVHRCLRKLFRKEKVWK